jgi:DNA helicase-2/ATP-dependent DNA helicase PcrA
MTQVATPTVADLAEGLVAGLDLEQCAAATLPDGPALIIAPAGSGKTTTLIARLGVLLSRGVAPEQIAVVTFNRDAALELSARISSRVVPSVPGAARIEVRTLHALARQVLLDHGNTARLVSDRLPLLRALLRRAVATAQPDDGPLPEAAALDTEISAWKVERRTPDHASLVEGYRALLAARGSLDFDDLVVGAAEVLEADAALRRRWQARFIHVCVDEFQDIDAAQLRLVRLLAEPERNLFVVGDDDQTKFMTRTYDSVVSRATDRTGDGARSPWSGAIGATRSSARLLPKPHWPAAPPGSSGGAVSARWLVNAPAAQQSRSRFHLANSAFRSSG